MTGRTVGAARYVSASTRRASVTTVHVRPALSQLRRMKVDDSTPLTVAAEPRKTSETARSARRGARRPAASRKMARPFLVSRRPKKAIVVMFVTSVPGGVGVASMGSSGMTFCQTKEWRGKDQPRSTAQRKMKVEGEMTTSAYRADVRSIKSHSSE